MKKYTRAEAERDLLILAHDERAGLIQEWLASRPQIIRDMYAKYSPKSFYRVKEGAPYRFTCEGCIVAIQSFFEDGGVRVQVLRDLSGYVGVNAAMDPQWLEPISIDEAFPPEILH